MLIKNAYLLFPVKRRHETLRNIVLLLHLTYIPMIYDPISYILYEEDMKYREYMSSIFQYTGNE